MDAPGTISRQKIVDKGSSYGLRFEGIDFCKVKGELIENAEAIQKNILAGIEDSNKESDAGELTADLLTEAALGICGNHDDRYGGFGDAPKFPPSMTLNFLRAIRPNVDSVLADRIDTVTHTTLRAMAHGGIFDQIGGGFARYSVDAHWLIPHFENVYDNAFTTRILEVGWIRRNFLCCCSQETMGWLEGNVCA